MLKSKLFLSSLVICALATSCGEQAMQTPLVLEQDTVNTASKKILPYQDKLSPSILKIISTPDQILNNDDLIKEDEFDADYVDHFKFFTEIDKTGSGVEEVLEHDGYLNAQKYVVHWRGVLGENMDWPDHNSTTYKGPFKALEHAALKSNGGWFGLRNAKQKSDEYYNMALKSWRKGLPADAPEQKQAWEWLGRTAHFIQDSTVPHHTRVLIRFDQLTHHPYEVSVTKNFSKYFPSKNYDAGAWNGSGPYPVSGNDKWGVYFDKNITASQIVKSNSDISYGLFKIANHKDDENNGNWDKVRAVMLPLATKSCAGLIVNFLEQVGETP